MKKFLTLLTIALSLVLINHSCKPDSQKCVDLGLPSGLKWATCNVGANSPEEYGSYLTFNQACDTTYDGLRMPTMDELDELRTQCTWTWTEQNGVNGYKVTGPNGNSIFLPAAGYRKGSLHDHVGSEGNYWSSTPGSYNDYCRAYFLFFVSRAQDMFTFFCSEGRSVRLVAE